MKKVGKTLLIAGTVVAMSIGTAGIMNINNMQKEENKATIQAYNHTPANILDNVFERNNVKYLPFIYDSPMLDDEITPRTISKTEVVNAFASRNLEVEFSTGDIRTGTRISVKGSSDVYTVVIYGDVDGDGCVDTFDAQAVVDYYINGEIGLNEVCKIAANVDNDTDEIDTFDAQKIIDFYLGTTTKLVLNEPNHIVESDTTPPVIKFDGQVVTGTQTKKLKVGDTFNEPTVTATDNVDGDVTTKIVRTGDTVNTNVADTYTITYTVSDAKGNTATVIYIVYVENEDVPPTPQVTFDGIRVDGISSLELPILETTYTNVPVTFLKNGQAADGEITANILRDKNFSIEVPKIKIPGQSTSTNDDAILVEYNQTGKIEQIGFKVANDAIKMMDSDKIKFKIGNQTIAELEVEIKYNEYNEQDKIIIDTTSAEMENLKQAYSAEEYKDAYYEDAYAVKKDTLIKLGVIRVQNGKQPLLVGDVTGNVGNGVWIECKEYDAEGNLIVKAKITETEKKAIILKANVNGTIISSDAIEVLAFDKPEITLRNMDGTDLNLDNQEINHISLKYSDVTRERKTQLTITDAKALLIPSKYITITQTKVDNKEYLKISKLKLEDIAKVPVESEDPTEYISLEVDMDQTEITQPIVITVTVSFYKGIPKLETTKTFNVEILPKNN